MTILKTTLCSLLTFVISGAILTGCNKFLDIQPKGTMPKALIFDSEQGFKDALYGIYASMASESLYGAALTYGFVDKLGQLFMYNNTENPDTYILRYDYLNAVVRPTIDQIWSDQYTIISYVNELIDAYETTTLSGTQLDMIGGEAYALRAFLHFDLARLFCTDYTRGGERTGLSYAFKADLKNKRLCTLEETYRYILDDLDRAEELLRADGSLYLPMGTMSDTYLDERYAHLNKYAVEALRARVYYTMGDLTRAGECARKVINADVVAEGAPEGTTALGLVPKESFASVKRFPAEGELLFGLYAPRVAQHLYDTFLQNTASGSFTEARTDLTDLYETDQFTATSVDLRYSEYYKKLSGNLFAFTRFMSDETELESNAFEGVMLIRLPEMYFILSESLYDSDPSEAIALLNQVRKSRGLEAVKEDKVNTKAAFLSEMMRERMREMPGEGQIFLAYKHYDMPILDRRGKETFPAGEEIFVLPRPEKEKEFGEAGN